MDKELRYFNWIMKKFIKLGWSSDYHLLLIRLFKREFYWTIEKDGNRAKDGIEIRERYCNETGEEWPLPDKGCTVLEMLIALSCRLDADVLYDYEVGERSEEWFWMFLDNLGLSKYNNREFDQDAVDEILDIFMDRRYGKDGKGGMFPLKSQNQKQHVTEIWFQMQNYVLENFEI